MRAIPHLMIDVVNPKKKYSVAEYQKEAKRCLQLTDYGLQLPIIVGGTGLYIDALINDWQLPEVPPNKILRKELEKKSEIELFELLKKLDPQRAAVIDSKNKVRLIRSIEIIKKLG